MSKHNGFGTDWQGPADDRTLGPVKGVSVVYVLYDDDLNPCYVGSTYDFRNRIREHVKSGKQFSYWRCVRCSTRSEAYERERQMLTDAMPYLNKRTY